MYLVIYHSKLDQTSSEQSACYINTGSRRGGVTQDVARDDHGAILCWLQGDTDKLIGLANEKAMRIERQQHNYTCTAGFLCDSPAIESGFICLHQRNFN